MMFPGRPRQVTRELARLAELADRGEIPARLYAPAMQLVLAGMAADAAAAKARIEGLTPTE